MKKKYQATITNLNTIIQVTEFTEERTDQEIEHGGTESKQGNKLTSSSSSSVSSLLSVLRAPRLSDLTRKRKTPTNPGKLRKKTRPSSSVRSEPKGVKFYLYNLHLQHLKECFHY